MLACEWKPTTQPALSPSAMVVTTTRAESADVSSVPYGPSSMAWPFQRAFLPVLLVAEEERVLLHQGPLQRELARPGAGRGEADRQRVPAHHRRDRQAQFVEAVRGDEPAEPGGPALAEHDAVAQVRQRPHGRRRL